MRVFEFHPVESNLGQACIRKYLKEGSKIGFCHYDTTESVKIANSNILKRARPVKMYKNNVAVGIFKSREEIEKNSLKLFNVKLLRTCIG